MNLKRLLLILLTLFLALHVFSQLKSPEAFFGFKPGSDRELFDYEELIDYLQMVDENSPRLEMMEIGHSPMGKPIYVAFFSSEENINNLDRLKEINSKLAIDPEIEDSERDGMISEGKVFFLATLSMHSTEVGPSQSAPLIAYDLATTNETYKLSWLNDVVYMMVPCHNPDGMDMIIDHYKKYKDTKYEGSSLPGLYHKYVGHDNNRDFVALTQEDTKAIASVYNLEWFPQVMVEKHQMGSSGVRYFVPPPHDPIAENIDAGIWNWIGIFGSNMMTDMTAEGLQGIAQNYLFDDYWPGSTETCLWKNVIGMLTEAASVKVATPIYIEPTELKVWGKGLSEYKKSINMPELWPGGWWHLSDIIDYEISSTYSIIKTSALYKNEILKFRNDLCRKEVEKGKNQAPYYYIIPQKQHDQGEMVRLVNLLREHGVKVYSLDDKIATSFGHFSKGDIVVPLAQAFRAFIKEMMEKQTFPLRHYTPNGEIIRPYDITSWSLPLHNGVNALEINSPIKGIEDKLTEITIDYSLKEGLMTEYFGFLFPVENNESYKAAFYASREGFHVERLTEDLSIDDHLYSKGSFIIFGHPKNKKTETFYNELSVDPVFLYDRPDMISKELVIPKIALVETNMHDMDAGWTRYVFDSYHLPFTILKPADFEGKELSEEFDVIIFPSNNADIIKEGKYKSSSGYYMSRYPPEFVKGMGSKGMDKLMEFLDEGGLIISWGRSTDLFKGSLSIKNDKDNKEEFQLPFSNISSKLEGLYCPGSFVRLNLKNDHPITYGMKDQTGVFYRGRPVFSTSQPGFDMDRRIIGTFPEKDILISGYIEKAEKLGNKSGLLWLKKGKGQLVLMAFNPQFRASTAANYKLLFNSILLAPEM